MAATTATTTIKPSCGPALPSPAAGGATPFQTSALTFELLGASAPPRAAGRGRGGRAGRCGFASLTAAKAPSVGGPRVASPPRAATAPPPPPPPPTAAAAAAKPKVELKPASDVLAGAVARAASQSTIHPLDTLKVRMQVAGGGASPPPPAPLSSALARLGSLYAGVGGAAAGAGAYIGAYFAVYGAAANYLATHAPDLPPAGVAFAAGAAGAVGGSVVKVPLAVCIRSVQAGLYPSAPAAGAAIFRAAGLRGLFTGYVPTLLEDVPDMAVKFATYEALRAAHGRAVGGARPPSVGEDFAMGAAAGAAAAAATTPLDVIKTNMMCSATARPTMGAAARAALARAGPAGLFAGVGPRALSNGINSAVFFAFFSALRRVLQERAAAAAGGGGGGGGGAAKAAAAARPRRGALASLTVAGRGGLPPAPRRPRVALV